MGSGAWSRRARRRYKGDFSVNEMARAFCEHGGARFTDYWPVAVKCAEQALGLLPPMRLLKQKPNASAEGAAEGAAQQEDGAEEEQEEESRRMSRRIKSEHHTQRFGKRN